MIQKTKERKIIIKKATKKVRNDTQKGKKKGEKKRKKKERKRRKKAKYNIEKRILLIFFTLYSSNKDKSKQSNQ